jgi:6-pyruvoyltetrahydropterin/6-carboxytetrahydropterin synthase
VLEEFDHKNLNLDTPYFESLIPTSENLARVLWTKLDTQESIGRLHAIRLYEDEDLYADVTAASGLDVASVTRRYSFTAMQDGMPGPEWDCFVTIHGAIDSVTGMVTDIGALNRLVQEKVVQRFDRHDLRQALGTQTVTGEQMVEYIWKQLIGSLPSGKLSNVRLVQSRDMSFEYSG